MPAPVRDSLLAHRLGNIHQNLKDRLRALLVTEDRTLDAGRLLGPAFDEFCPPRPVHQLNPNGLEHWLLSAHPLEWLSSTEQVFEVCWQLTCIEDPSYELQPLDYGRRLRTLARCICGTGRCSNRGEVASGAPRGETVFGLMPVHPCEPGDCGRWGCSRKPGQLRQGGQAHCLLQRLGCIMLGFMESAPCATIILHDPPCLGSCAPLSFLALAPVCYVTIQPWLLCRWSLPQDHGGHTKKDTGRWMLEHLSAVWRP